MSFASTSPWHLPFGHVYVSKVHFRSVRSVSDSNQEDVSVKWRKIKWTDIYMVNYILRLDFPIYEVSDTE